MSRIKVFPGDNRKYAAIPIEGNGKHYKCKCQAKVRNSDGILCYCTFECRADHLSDSIKNGKLHTCTPGAPVGSGIAEYFTQPASNTGTENFSAQALYERLITFIGRKNISMTIGASDELYELLVYAFACGAKHGNKASPIESAKKFIPHYKRDKLTDMFIKTADNIHKNTMKLFSNDCMPYVSVAIDEGSTVSRKLLDFCLENPEYPIVSYPGTTIRMPNTTFEAYNVAILCGLRDMDKFNITFSALIVDGAKGQAKALNDDDPLSLFNRTNIKWVKALLVIPCMCHRTNNAFKSACSKPDNGLCNLVNFIHQLPDQLNAHVKEIGATCPGHISTRWTCDFFLCDFVINHEQKCRQFMIIGDDFKMFYDVAVIFYAMIQIFEDPKCSLSSVYPIITDALSSLDDLDNEGNKFALTFKVSLQNYTLESKDKGI